jgi:hypothetical protein
MCTGREIRLRISSSAGLTEGVGPGAAVLAGHSVRSRS